MNFKKTIILLVTIFLAALLCNQVLAQRNITDISMINNRDYALALIKEIKSAKYSIHVAMFSITYYKKYVDSSANKILKALAEARKRGVDVKVIVDEFPKKHQYGTDYLINNGVSVRYDGKDQSTHSKLIIVDSKIVIIGSTNWRYHSLDKANEANVLIKSDTLAMQYAGYFQEIWKKGNDVPLSENSANKNEVR